MRLLHAKDYIFKEFIGKQIPEYAIISHRWNDDEVTYQDFLDGRNDFLRGRSKGYGWYKIKQAGKLCTNDGLEWFWIDTCKQPAGENYVVVWYADIES